jgi:hypothetical protein
MKYPTLLLLGACLAIAPFARATDDPAAFRIRFGVLREDKDGNSSLVAETTDLVRKFKATGYRWGFEITTSAANVPFEYQFVFHLPAPPDQVTGDLAKTNPEKPGTTISSEKTRTSETAVIHSFWFDPGDPTGNWQIEIWVNGKLARTISFRVRNE